MCYNITDLRYKAKEVTAMNFMWDGQVFIDKMQLSEDKTVLGICKKTVEVNTLI